MKKIITAILISLSLTACSLTNTPKAKVETYLSEYNSLSENVKEDLETKVVGENLSKENQEIYKKVLTRQYQDLKFEIKDESIDGEKATVRVKITVYDLYKVDKTSLDYLNNNNDEFMDNGILSDDLYNNYKLSEMLKANEKIDYEVDFYLDKKDGEWVLQNPDRVVLEKIHGLYNYENE